MIIKINILLCNMVKTRVELKDKLKSWINSRDIPFTTQQAKEEMFKESKNIMLSPNRLCKYIKATGVADYNKKDKTWIRLKPNM